MMVRSEELSIKCMKYKKKITVIDLASNKSFQKRFVKNLRLPD